MCFPRRLPQLVAPSQPSPAFWSVGKEFTTLTSICQFLCCLLSLLSGQRSVPWTSTTGEKQEEPPVAWRLGEHTGKISFRSLPRALRHAFGTRNIPLVMLQRLLNRKLATARRPKVPARASLADQSKSLSITLSLSPLAGLI